MSHDAKAMPSEDLLLTIDINCTILLNALIGVELVWGKVKQHKM